MPFPARRLPLTVTLALAICGVCLAAMGADEQWQPVRKPGAGSPGEVVLRGASHQQTGKPDKEFSLGRKSDPSSSKSRSGWGSFATTFSALAVVLGLFFLVTWLMRRHMPGGSASLPAEVMEVLGHGSVAPKQPVHLVRLGDRLLLLSSGASGMETLCEITNPDEVTRLAGLCHEAHPQSATAAFRQVFQHLSHPSRTTEQEDRHG